MVTVDRSKNVKGKLVSKYDQFMYNFETGVKTIISEDTVKWLSVYKETIIKKRLRLTSGRFWYRGDPDSYPLQPRFSEG